MQLAIHNTAEGLPQEKVSRKLRKELVYLPELTYQNSHAVKQVLLGQWLSGISLRCKRRTERQSEKGQSAEVVRDRGTSCDRANRKNGAHDNLCRPDGEKQRWPSPPSRNVSVEAGEELHRPPLENLLVGGDHLRYPGFHDCRQIKVDLGEGLPMRIHHFHV